MGILTDLATAANPQAQQAYQAATQNAAQQQALNALVQQTQSQPQQQGQQLDQSGQPMNPQQQAAYAPFLQMLAQQARGNMGVAAAGNNPQAFQAAQAQNTQMQSPFAALQMQMQVQQQAAALAQTQATGLKDSIVEDAAGNKVHVNPSTGQQTPIGVTTPYATKEVQQLHDLKKFQGIQQSGGYGTAPQQNGQPAQGDVGGLINQAFMTDAQKAAAAAQQEQQAKAVQSAQEDVVNVNNMAQQSLAGIDQLQKLNTNQNLPRGAYGLSPEEQADIENQVGQTTGTTTPMADAWNQWQQTNSGKLVGAVKNFMAGATGSRIDLPLVKAITAANGATTEGSQAGTAERLNQYRTEIYNAQITAKNKLAQIQNPNAPAIPIKPTTVPYNPKAQTFTMQQVKQKAAQRGISPNDVINAIHKSGNWVQQ